MTRPGVSAIAVVSSETCDSVEVSMLGLLERDSSEVTCEDCCETALDFSLDSQDVKLKRPLGAVSILAILIGGS